MESPFYQATTYWVLFLCVVSLVIFLSLMRAGKASMRKIMIGGVLFGVSILLFHWVFGGHNLFSPDIPGGSFYLIILSV